MTDYRHRLAEQLRAAAQEQLTNPASSPRRGRQRLLLGGLAAAAVLAPAGLAASGVLTEDTRRGEFPDGSTFEAWAAPDAEYGSCEHFELRGPDGEFGGHSTACPARQPGDRPPRRLAVGFIATPADTVLLQGTAPDGTASIEVADAIGRVRFDRTEMRFVAQIPRTAPILVLARDGDGRELDRFTGKANLELP